MPVQNTRYFFVRIISIVMPHPPFDFYSLPLHELAKSPDLMSGLRNLTRCDILIG